MAVAGEASRLRSLLRCQWFALAWSHHCGRGLSMLSGRRYRLELTAEQSKQCQEFGDICRAVWNTGLEQRREYRRRGAWMNYVPQCAELAEAKRDHPWLKTAPAQLLQQTLRDLDRACREHSTFKVRWRSKARWSPSFRFPAGKSIAVERQGREWGRVKPRIKGTRGSRSQPVETSAPAGPRSRNL
ncbi:helix-turn-helix domain-containing protein [Streptomyces platensis]|uniref:helix-turn-helix domain-containing protein n=1 Tax=Streptomyces platensis TaxID=58346 RepID=UPI003685E223